MDYVIYKDKEYGVKDDVLDLTSRGINDISDIHGGKKISSKLIEELGGLENQDYAKDIQKFMVYCQKKN